MQFFPLIIGTSLMKTSFSFLATASTTANYTRSTIISLIGPLLWTSNQGNIENFPFDFLIKSMPIFSSTPTKFSWRSSVLRQTSGTSPRCFDLRLLAVETHFDSGTRSWRNWTIAIGRSFLIGDRRTGFVDHTSRGNGNEPTLHFGTASM